MTTCDFLGWVVKTSIALNLFSWRTALGYVSCSTMWTFRQLYGETCLINWSLLPTDSINLPATWVRHCQKKSSAPVKSLNVCTLADILNVTIWEMLGTTPLNCSQFLTHRNHKVIYFYYCFKSLNLEAICYSTRDN